MSLKNQKNYALVTGASSGIGWALAFELAEKKFDLIVVARREERLNALKKEIQKLYDVDVVVMVEDLSKVGAAQKLFQKTESQNLNVTLLANNAGFGDKRNFIESDFQKNYDMLNLNIQTLTELSYLYGRKMCQNKNGWILQVSSVAAFQAVPGMNVYSASKAYVLEFGLALHHEFKSHNVSVTTLCPGMTNTEFFDVARQSVSESLKKWGGMSPEKVAKLAVKALFKKKSYVVCGLMNRFNAFFMKHLPRRVTTSIAAKVVKKTM